VIPIKNTATDEKEFLNRMKDIAEIKTQQQYGCGTKTTLFL